ncbi:MAG: hypothetical protein AAGA80_00650 [Cyanobacteria bacterium P01_F01_bin.143]
MQLIKLKLINISLILTSFFQFWSMGIYLANAQESEKIATIIEISGNASLRRINNSTNLLLAVGTELYDGDLIFPEQDAKVFLECKSDSSKRRLPRGVISGVRNICPILPEKNPPKPRIWLEDLLDFSDSGRSGQQTAGEIR